MNHITNKHEAWQFWYKEKGAFLEEGNLSTLRKMMEAYLAGYQAAQQSEQADGVCPECNTPGGYHKTGCSLWQWEPRKR